MRTSRVETAPWVLPLKSHFYCCSEPEDPPSPSHWILLLLVRSQDTWKTKAKGKQINCHRGRPKWSFANTLVPFMPSLLHFYATKQASFNKDIISKVLSLGGSGKKGQPFHSKQGKHISNGIFPLDWKFCHIQ